VKRKDDNRCRCNPAPFPEECRRRDCQYGYCAEFVCPRCNLYSMGWGPVFCTCEFGKPRPYLYPDMDVKTHVPVKQNAKHKHR
jgi:hypothetical protein